MSRERQSLGNLAGSWVSLCITIFHMTWWWWWHLKILDDFVFLFHPWDEMFFTLLSQCGMSFDKHKITWKLLPEFFRIAGKLLGHQNVVINMSGTSYFICMLQERRHQCCQLSKIIALGKFCSTTYTFHFRSTILHWKKPLISKTVKLIRTLCYQLDRKWENVNLNSSLCIHTFSRAKSETFYHSEIGYLVCKCHLIISRQRKDSN